MRPTIPAFVSVLQLIAALALTGLAGGALAGAPSEPDTVAEATLVIGVARVTTVSGAVRTLDRGAVIRVGDSIETGAGGHVHLRFVDGARLSVRPSSHLQIENYNRNPEQPALTAIKFRLDEGVVRSITGAWGEAARDKFRLNTPVAAIGVKGTDFVVKSDASNTQASVYTGAIVLAPLSPACQASLGPCLGGSEKLLSEDMKGQMLSLSAQQTTPQLVAAVDLLAQLARTGGNDVAAMQEAGTALGQVGEKAAVIESRGVDVVAIKDVPALLEAQKPPQVTQLVWARMAAIAADGDTISRSFAQAATNGRHPTVGNFVNTLYRDGAAGTSLSTADVSANFRLAGASANVVWNDGNRDIIDPAKVSSGTLKLDFAHASYVTQLDVASARIGTDTVVSSGSVSPSGIFRGASADTVTGGALSLDGKEAAYFFQKAYTTGQLRGITLWGR